MQWHRAGVRLRLPLTLPATADGANDDLTRVEPDAELHRHSVRAPDLLAVTPHRRLHVDRGVARADRMVLVGHRRTEEGHDAVPHDLVDGALVAMDRFHHP